MEASSSSGPKEEKYFKAYKRKIDINAIDKSKISFKFFFS